MSLMDCVVLGGKMYCYDEKTQSYNCYTITKTKEDVPREAIKQLSIKMFGLTDPSQGDTDV